MPAAHVLNVVLQAVGQVMPVVVQPDVAVPEGVAADVPVPDTVAPVDWVIDAVRVDDDVIELLAGAGPHSDPVVETSPPL